MSSLSELAVSSPMDEMTRARLRKEKDELNVYARTHLTTFVSWFTYYASINTVAIGWLATQAMRSAAVAHVVDSVFAFASVMAILACFVAIRHFSLLGRRERLLVETLNEEGTRTIIPTQDYVVILLLLGATCAAILIAWLALFRVGLAIAH